MSVELVWTSNNLEFSARGVVKETWRDFPPTVDNQRTANKHALDNFLQWHEPVAEYTMEYRA